MKPENRELVGVVGQYGSGCLLIAGLIVECVCRAHIGFILLTAGGLLWGVSTKIRGK